VVFEWPIKGVNQNKSILQGVNQKNILQDVKPKMTYITGGKALLTLDFTMIIVLRKELDFC